MNGSLTRTDNGRYRVRWRDPDGTSRSKTFDHRMDAKRFLALARSATAFGRSPEVEATPNARLSEIAEEWWSLKRPKLAYRTAESYEIIMRKHLAPLMQVQVDSIEPRRIEKVLAALPAVTASRTKLVLNQIVVFALRNQLATTNPVSMIDRIPMPESQDPALPSISEVEQIADLTNGYGVLIKTAAFSGLRFGELAGLSPSHIDLSAQTIRVERQWNHLTNTFTKVKTPQSRRTVLFADRLLGPLTEHLAACDTDLVFTSPTDRPINAHNFRSRVWRPAVAALGLEPLRFHDLRHVYASLLIKAGVNVSLVARLLGHSSPRTTMTVYAGWFEDDMDAARIALAES